jgi:hypothetical protein
MRNGDFDFVREHADFETLQLVEIILSTMLPQVLLIPPSQLDYQAYQADDPAFPTQVRIIVSVNAV